MPLFVSIQQNDWNSSPATVFSFIYNFETSKANQLPDGESHYPINQKIIQFV